MTRNEITKTPYLPGSAIKGAIRTAIANRFVGLANIKSGDSYGYNNKIFGMPTADPMKNIKISDVSLDEFGSAIFEAREHSPKDKKTPKDSYEAAVSFCQTDMPVVYPLKMSLNPFALHGKTVDIKFLIDSLYRFYTPKFIEEYEKFYKDEAYKEIRQAITPLNMEALKLKTNEAFVRIGHFSHVECVTLDNVRKPKTRIKDGKPMPWGKTRTLANGIYPFGWVKLEFSGLESVPRDEAGWPFSVEEIEDFIQERTKMIREKEKLVVAKAAIEKKGAIKKKEQEKKERIRNAMSPEERDIYDISNSPEITKNRVVEIYNKIDEFPKENKINVASALKKYWQDKGNWERGKEKKTKAVEKQLKRVKKIKEILGE